MFRAMLLGGVLLCVGFVLAQPAQSFGQPAAYDIPRLENISIDGRPDDWGDKGFRVNVLMSVDGRTAPVEDYDLRLRLAWCEKGLLVLAPVRDDVGAEAEKLSDLWTLDSLELFVGAKLGSPMYYQVIVASGRDKRFGKVRVELNDRRQPKAPPLKPLAAEVASTVQEGGYTIEALLPWENLGVRPSTGLEVAFQVYATDSDAPDDVSNRLRVVWFPSEQSHVDSQLMYRLRLAEKASEPINAAANAGYEGMRRAVVRVVGVAELAGKPVEVSTARGVLASGKLEPVGGRASAKLIAPVPPVGRPYGELTVRIDGTPAAVVTIPDVDQVRARAMIRAPLTFQPGCVFRESQFPTCDFTDPLAGEDLIGPYTIETTYYDAAFNPVTQADKPGRYGAVVTIRPQNGRVTRRFVTLFRAPADMPNTSEWLLRWIKVQEEPTQLERAGLDLKAAKRQSESIRSFLYDQVDLARSRSSNELAQLLAGIYDTPPEGPKTGPADDAMALDRQWWVTLKRKLYGTDKLFPKPLAAPRPVEGPAARVIREGTLAEAGMKPGAADAIDGVCRDWAANTQEAFAVCIVRHGVVVLHKAYGTRDGKPMTVDTPSWMASITKFLSGTLMTMAIDQGLVSLNDPVDKFLPPFRDVKVDKTLTIRHLYTHTCGLWDHWGDEMNDFEEVVGAYYPFLKVGERFEYNGAGYALGGKIIETVSGEAIPQFFRKHLLDPLGCELTLVSDTCAGSRSVPMDIARIAQMILNGGAYGSKRFFSEEAARAMRPGPLTDILGPGAVQQRGVGTELCEDGEFGPGEFGHGAASGAVLRIAPSRDLVVVMTRNSSDKDYGLWVWKFFAAIRAGMVDEPATAPAAASPGR